MPIDASSQHGHLCAHSNWALGGCAKLPEKLDTSVDPALPTDPIMAVSSLDSLAATIQ